MRKEFLLSAKLDTSEFDKSIQEITKKLKDISQPIGAMQASTSQRMQQQGLGGVSSQTMETYQKSTQAARRELDQLIASQAKSQKELGHLIAKRSEDAKKMVEEQKKLVSGSKEELELIEKISRHKQNTRALEQGWRERDEVMNRSLDAREKLKLSGFDRMRAAYQGGGIGGAATAAGRMARNDPMGALNLGAGAIASISTAGAAAGQYAERFTGYGQRIQEARGSAIENTVGQNLRDIYSGRSPFENQWQSERTAAAGLAEQKEGRNRITDRAKGVGSIGGMLAGGALMAGGLLVGGASIAGAPFTAGGSALGLPAAAGMITAGGAAFGFGANGMANDRTRQSINPFGQKEYSQMLAKDQAIDFRNNYEALKNQDSEKKQILERFETEKDRNVNSQRQLGLSNSQFYKDGGFLSNIAAGGYMPGQGMNMANSIVQAGGSSRMGTQARFGLDMERSGLTNASSILGSMSGSIQNPEANKRATIAIMSEAFKIGLDNTDFAEENRRFAQAAANVIGRTGATSEGDQEKISAALAQFMGQKTNVGVQEAQTAYERSQERGSQTKDRRGALRFQHAMQDKDLSKMSTSDLTELLSMRPEELNSSNPVVAEFARAANITPEELIEKMTGEGGVNAAGRFTFPGQKDKISETTEKINKYMKENKLSTSDLGDQSREGKLPASIQEAIGRRKIEFNKSEAGGITGRDSTWTEGLTGYSSSSVDFKSKAKKDIFEGPGRMEDLFTKQASEGADEARKSFNRLSDTLLSVVKDVNALTEAVAPMGATIGGAASANRANLPRGNPYNTDIGNTASGAQSQPQGNKPKK